MADQKKAGMDKLYYYIKQADRVAPLYLAQAETYRNKLQDHVVAVMTSSDDLASHDIVEDHNEEESELDDDEISENQEDSDEDVDEPDEEEGEETVQQEVSCINFEQ